VTVTPLHGDGSQISTTSRKQNDRQDSKLTYGTHTYRTPFVASCGALAVPSAGAREGSALAALLMRSAWIVECAGGEPVAEQQICFTPAALYRGTYRLSNLRSALQWPILATVNEERWRLND